MIYVFSVFSGERGKASFFFFSFFCVEKRETAVDEQQGKQIIGGFRTFSTVSAPFREARRRQTLPLPETNKE